MLFIGDIHGQIDNYLDIIEGESASIQVGDFGYGFIRSPGFIRESALGDPDIPEISIPPIPSSHRFIRGNHDDPELCRQSKNYLGDYGYLSEEDIFFISGAYSIDKDNRIPGVSWWEEEELSYAQFMDAISLYNKCRPKVVVSHDCPKVVAPFSYHIERSRTNQALEQMLEIHKPALWIFGHHHTACDKTLLGTRFICLPELATFKL